MIETLTGIPAAACVGGSDTELSMDADTLAGLYE